MRSAAHWPNVYNPAMNAEVFLPLRKRGLIIHGAALLLLAGGSAVLFWLAFDQAVGGAFLLLLLGALLLAAPVPLAAYRGYALLTAHYEVERDGLRLRWGLRGEDIPLPDIEWVRPVSDLTFDLPLPRLSWPGAYLGTRMVGDLGMVEFMASELGDALLVAARDRVYVLSPADAAGFTRALQRAFELGSISPFKAYTALPAVYLARVWSDRVARVQIAAGLGLSLAVLAAASLIIPSRPAISLGFLPNGLPVEPGPSSRLLLLPVLAILAYVMDLIGGMFFYRNVPTRAVAYVFWSAGVIAPLLLLLALAFLK